MPKITKRELYSIFPREKKAKTGMLMCEVQTDHGWNMCRDKIRAKLDNLWEKLNERT